MITRSQEQDATLGEGLLSTHKGTFNRLAEAISSQRAELAAWEQYSTGFQQRLACELLPIEGALQQARLQLIQGLDALLSKPSLSLRISKRNRIKLRAYIVYLLEDSLVEAAEPELQALYDRHSGISTVKIRQRDMDEAETRIAEVYGSDILVGHRATTPEELWFQVRSLPAGKKNQGENHNLGDNADECRRQQPWPDSAPRDRVLPQDTTVAPLRGVYRSLVSALHPDRETCPRERLRKTALMQRVNRAYAGGDLLELLSLQLERGLIHDEALSHLPDAHLQSYNKILHAQHRALQDRLQELRMTIRAYLNLPSPGLTMTMVDKAMNRAVAATRANHQALEYQLQKLPCIESDDLLALHAFFDSIPNPEDYRQPTNK